jgi:hypothetical protein
MHLDERSGALARPTGFRLRSLHAPPSPACSRRAGRRRPPHAARAAAGRSGDRPEPSPTRAWAASSSGPGWTAEGHTQAAGQAHAEVMALRDAQAQGRDPCRRHRLRHAGALRPPRPHAALLRRADRRAHRPRGGGAGRPQPAGRRRRPAPAARRRHRRSTSACAGDEAPRTERRLPVAHAARAALRAAEGRGVAGRPHRAGRRPQPVDHRPRGAARRPRLAAARRGHPDRHRHGAGRRPAAGRARRAHREAAAAGGGRRPGCDCRPPRASCSRRVRCASTRWTPTATGPAPARAWACRCCRGARAAGPHRPGPGAARPGGAGRERTARRGRAAPERVAAGGRIAVDELLVYLAPMFIGPGRAMAALDALPQLADARRFEFVEALRVGADVRLRARATSLKPARRYLIGQATSGPRPPWVRNISRHERVGGGGARPGAVQSVDFLTLAGSALPSTRGGVRLREPWLARSIMRSGPAPAPAESSTMVPHSCRPACLRRLSGLVVLLGGPVWRRRFGGRPGDLPACRPRRIALAEHQSARSRVQLPAKDADLVDLSTGSIWVGGYDYATGNLVPRRRQGHVDRGGRRGGVP